MRKIKLFPAPHVEVRIYVSEQMETDLKRCKESAALLGSGADCDTCSWNHVQWCNTGMCELPVVLERLMEEKQDEGRNSNG